MKEISAIYICSICKRFNTMSIIRLYVKDFASERICRKVAYKTYRELSKQGTHYLYCISISDDHISFIKTTTRKIGKKLKHFALLKNILT